MSVPIFRSNLPAKPCGRIKPSSRTRIGHFVRDIRHVRRINDVRCLVDSRVIHNRGIFYGRILYNRIIGSGIVWSLVYAIPDVRRVFLYVYYVPFEVVKRSVVRISSIIRSFVKGGVILYDVRQIRHVR
jgi:hypothetical protein